MPRDTCDHTCEVPSTIKKPTASTSLSSVQSHVPQRDFAVATATLVTVNFCFHNSGLFCFILNDAFDMPLQQETLYFGYANLASNGRSKGFGAFARAEKGAAVN